MKNLFKIFILMASLQMISVNVFAFATFVCRNDETTIYRSEASLNVLEFVSEDGDGERLRTNIHFTTRRINGNRETQTYFFAIDDEPHALSVSARRDLWQDENGEGTLFLIDLENRRVSEEAQFTCRATVD